MSLTKQQIGALSLFAVLIALSFTDFFHQSSVEFEEKSSKEITDSILIIEEIETLTIPLAESIPFVKSWASTYQQDFHTLVNYLSFADLLMVIQLTVLKISDWWLFKTIMVILFLGLFIPKIQKTCAALLILSLMISPGLGIYTKFMSGITHQMSLDLGTDLKSHLAATKDSISTKKAYHQSKLDSLEIRQKAKHKGKLNLFDKAEDEVIKVADVADEEVEKIGKDLLAILRFASQHALELMVALMVNIIVVFGLLPFLYWYLFSLGLKRFFGYHQPFDELSSKLDELKRLLPDQSKLSK
ncbi:hypothetical protein PBT90_12125 [Algoriphagus halophytocola]|uniref:Uncharacterized protein n=1 Tax=Algoriphagus halophytocola TaxID=2991499 RepID=A0ABY6MP75_9BACT|nr:MULTISPECIES: hypothetical protein [unclassified Algoriphagus]UZD24131.1 hypothetical protein OM944_06435 [Algoriphagus sp. TR-M5]WBL41502.1 hypothetical protein PBT90_12125 [Algoriphagus sp. TR-M9]